MQRSFHGVAASQSGTGVQRAAAVPAWMSFSGARLAINLVSASALTLAAILALLFELPQQIFAEAAPTAMEHLAGLLLFLSLYIVVTMPFDLAAGYALPRWFAREHPRFGMYLTKWFQGVAVQMVLMTWSGFLILMAGQWGGVVAGLAAVALIMLLLLAAQEWIAAVAAGTHRVYLDMLLPMMILEKWKTTAPPVAVYAASDAAFTGGIVGLPGREKVILPYSWFRRLPQEYIALEIVRRSGLIKSFSRVRGVIIAFCWNLSGFALAALVIPGAGVATTAGVISTALGFTVWSYAGILALPLVTRPGAFEADDFALSRGIARPLVEQTAVAITRLQDERPERNGHLDRFLYPQPSVRARSKQREDRPGYGGWYAAQLALYLSWGCLNLLSRSAYGIQGRPSLWAMPPSD